VDDDDMEKGQRPKEQFNTKDWSDSGHFAALSGYRPIQSDGQQIEMS
jgi:hypothetical protein